jgi:hypothetical protein
MTAITEERDKALVLRAFDTLFNNRLRGGALLVEKDDLRVVGQRRDSQLQLRLQLGLLIAFAVSLLFLQGCTQVVRSESTTPNHRGAPNMIRTLGPDQTFSNLSIHSVARRVRASHDAEVINILAMSAGGADGAFGAGALVGLTRSGLRPQFTIVTGVSAGALIAPYAFLGPAWDSQLVEIYTTGRAEHLLRPRGLGALFGSSVYRGKPLKELVDRYTTDALIQAVAREAAAGRLLLIVTTDVETGEPLVWDLGSIAMNGGPYARALFRDVLVASASVPGMFPPVIIHVQEQSTTIDEAHVDGTVSAPFFVPAGFAEIPEDEGDRPLARRNRIRHHRWTTERGAPLGAAESEGDSSAERLSGTKPYDEDDARVDCYER